MTIEEIKQLKDGSRVILTQTGSEWVEEDKGVSCVCVKIGNRLVDADIKRPDDSSLWYPYYSIDELNYEGYECTVDLENIDDDNSVIDGLKPFWDELADFPLEWICDELCGEFINPNTDEPWCSEHCKNATNYECIKKWCELKEKKDDNNQSH